MAMSTENNAGNNRRARRSQNCDSRTPPVRLFLLEQQRGDQVAGDDEEHLDAEEPAVHPPEAGMVEDDRDH